MEPKDLEDYYLKLWNLYYDATFYDNLADEKKIKELLSEIFYLGVDSADQFVKEDE